MSLAPAELSLAISGLDMRVVRERVLALVQASNQPVLLVGEPGTGRRTLARLIHRASERRLGPLLEFDASRLPGIIAHSELFGHLVGSFVGAYREKRGSIWRANCGGLLATEIGSWSSDAQTILESFLHTREVRPLGARAAMGRVDVRVIGTTREAGAPGSGRGAEHRLLQAFSGVEVLVPPLRRRRRDLPELFVRTVRACDPDASAPRLDADAEQLLLSHSWLGNFAELTVVARRVAGAGITTITAERLASAMTPASSSAARSTTLVRN